MKRSADRVEAYRADGFVSPIDAFGPSDLDAGRRQHQESSRRWHQLRQQTQTSALARLAR